MRPRQILSIERRSRVPQLASFARGLWSLFLLLLEFHPARVQRINRLLRRIQFQRCRVQARSIAHDRRVQQGVVFRLQFLLGRGNARLNALEFARFLVG